jgi:hypothetical protein
MGLHCLLQGQAYLYLTAICEPLDRENVEASTSHNSTGLHSLLQGQLYRFFTNSTNHLDKKDGYPWA